MGQVRFTWNGEKVKRAEREGLVKGLELSAEHLGGVSNEIAPIEEGTMIRSGVASVDERQLKAAYSYNTPYSARQHEELDYRHDPGRQAKFLEQPFHTEQPVFRAIIAAQIRKHLGT